MTKGFPIPPEKRVSRGFHGTNYDFEGSVLPQSKTGNAHFPGFSGSNDTYFLPAEGGDAHNNRKEAWRWAKATYNAESKSAPSRFRVHITEPIGEQHIDSNLHGHSAPYYPADYGRYARVAPEQKIVDTEWAPPALEDAGHSHIDQTFGHVNWNQFGAPNFVTHFTPNNKLPPLPDVPNAQLYDHPQWRDPFWQTSNKPKAPTAKRAPRQRKGQLGLPLE